MIQHNKKIVRRILADLHSFKELTLSSFTLESNVHLNMGAVDTTFPSQIKDIIDLILSKLSDHQAEQYAATLNTPEEGTHDQNLPVGNLFDCEIALLEEYSCSGKRFKINK